MAFLHPFIETAVRQLERTIIRESAVGNSWLARPRHAEIMSEPLHLRCHTQTPRYSPKSVNYAHANDSRSRTRPDDGQPRRRLGQPNRRTGHPSPAPKNPTMRFLAAKRRETASPQPASRPAEGPPAMTQPENPFRSREAVEARGCPSREAALECSPRRKPWVRSGEFTEPRRGERETDRPSSRLGWLLRLEITKLYHIEI